MSLASETQGLRDQADARDSITAALMANSSFAINPDDVSIDTMISNPNAPYDLPASPAYPTAPDDENNDPGDPDFQSMMGDIVANAPTSNFGYGNVIASPVAPDAFDPTGGYDMNSTSYGGLPSGNMFGYGEFDNTLSVADPADMFGGGSTAPTTPGYGFGPDAVPGPADFNGPMDFNSGSSIDLADLGLGDPGGPGGDGVGGVDGNGDGAGQGSSESGSSSSDSGSSGVG